ncbi:MAG: mandelate racemase/muconate lactonizing enzyme family protein [Ramlibacter sp.]
MKVTKVDVFTVVLPREIPCNYHVKDNWDLPAVVARVHTDAGIEGIGHTITLMPEHTRSLATLVEELGTLLVGEDPRRVEQLSAKMMYPANWIGPGGLLNIAASALDIALWDIVGKDSGAPLWRLLGGHSDRARVYESGGLISPDIDALQKAAARNVEMGHRAMKMRPGNNRHGRTSQVVEHVKAVRDVIGYDVDLMLDINQTWQAPRAIRAGRALEPLELFWIEDPVPMHDVAGQASVAEALDVPICSGEYHYGIQPLLRLLQARAVDYLMVDLLRVGGITQFRKVAGMAEAYGVPVASHLLPEVFAHLIAAIPNGLIVEGMPWTAGLFDGLPAFQQGQLLLSERPGHGLTLDEAFVRKHRVR